MDDRISELPAPILHHILSFLDKKEEVVRTCVVSKSWRHLWCTRPEFCLYELSFRKYREQFIDVLERSLQVYYDQKLCIDDFSVSMSKVNPALVLLLEKWIPIVAVKKFHLSFRFRNSALTSAVFESESLQEIYLRSCNLSQIQINSVVGNNLKTLHLQDVCIEDETFAKFLSTCSLIEDLSLSNVDVDEESFANVLSSCPLIERFALYDSKGSFRTIKMHNHHNLKSFELYNYVGSIEIYLPSTIGCIIIHGCPNWFHHRNSYSGLTCLELRRVPLSNEWFDSFSRSFPCIEDLRLWKCNGFDELKLSSRSIKKLHITMDESTTKATIDAPSIKEFFFSANISQSISFAETTSDEWILEIHLSLDQLDASQWFLKLSELVAAFCQSQISLLLNNDSDIGNPHIEHPSDISICCGSSCKPVVMKSLSLNLSGLYYDFFFSDLVIGLFRFVRPREIKQYRKDEFLCRTLQMGRWEEEDEGTRSFFSWKQDLEEVSLQVRFGSDSVEWRPVQGTINWSEYVAALHNFKALHFRLKWRE